MRHTLSVAFISLILGIASAQELSCSEASDPCLTPTPGGLFVLRQRFEPDVEGDYGNWGLDGLDVLSCDTQEPQNFTAYAPTFNHEEIGSFCLKSPLFSGENKFQEAEVDWAQSEVGEGVEELWERAWNTAGRFISTLDSKCMKANKKGRGVGVPEFFVTLRKLHAKFPTARLLAESDITPSDDTTYSLSELTGALSFHDNKPVMVCDNATLSTVLWPLVVRGTFEAGTFEPTSTFTRTSNCPSEGIIYQPSTTRPAPTETATWDNIHRPRPRPITLSHDESKLYYKSQVPEDPKKKLSLFKDYDQEKDEGREERAQRQFGRDEL